MSEWKEYKFSDFVAINPTISMKSTELYSFVEMKDLQDGKKYCYPSAERNPSSGARFYEGDTLFARITPCLENGKICKVRGLKNGIGFGSTEFLVFRGKENVSENEFVFICLDGTKSGDTQKAVLKEHLADSGFLKIALKTYS